MCVYDVLFTIHFKLQRAKKVFDPSDSHIPKRRMKSVKPASKQKKQDAKSKNVVNELLNYPAYNNVIDAVPISGHSSVTRTEMSQDKKAVCYMCSKTKHKKELMNCPICNIKGSDTVSLIVTCTYIEIIITILSNVFSS